MESSKQALPNTMYLKDFDPEVAVTLVEGLKWKELLAFPAFQTWKGTLKTSLSNQKYSDHALHETPYKLRSIKIQSFDKFNPKSETINFVKMDALVSNDEGSRLPGIVFLRGGSVAVLMIVRPTDSPEERWVIMTEQPRVPAGSLSFMEIPAGMMDGERNITGKAVQEIEEEVGMKLQDRDLIDMTKLAVQGHKVLDDVKMAMYPSPGGCDEWISILLWEKEIDRQQIETLKGKLTGNRKQHEMITLRLLNYERLLEVGGRDAKTLAAWSLYEYLKRTGQLPDRGGENVWRRTVGGADPAEP